MTESNFLALVIVTVVVLYVAYTYFGQIKEVLTSVVSPVSSMVGGGEPIPYEQSDIGVPVDLAPATVPATSVVEAKVVENAQVDVTALPYPQQSNNNAPLGGFQPELAGLSADQLTAQDLMPKEDNFSAWAASNPPVQGTLADKNYLPSGHHYGINTVGQSLRNANRGLRSDPVIPMREVGPWMQTTIEADTNRRTLEIGSS